MSFYDYVGGDPVNFVDPSGLCFLGKNLARKYIEKYGKNAWMQARWDRDAVAHKPVVPGSELEALRNAEHYLYAREEVQWDSYSWGKMHVLTTGYHVSKFWANVAEYYLGPFGVDSPWTYTIPTSDELQSGYQGANDGLFGDDSEDCECKE